MTPHTDDPTKNDYVVQLRAEYVDPIGPPTTHIWWFRNDGTEAFRKDDPIQVNKSVAIEGALTRSGYRFIGWAKVQQNGDTPATTTDAGPYLYYGDDGAFHLGSKTGTKVSKVAADERTPYDNMYAVWIPELKIRITGNTDTKEYNGQEQSVTGYTVEYSVGGGAYSTTAPSGVSVALAEGKTAEAAGTNVNTNPGYLMGLNSESFTISVNAEKYDFNATDDLTITDGWLKITPKKVTITAKDASKEYDGTALTQPEFTVSGLAEGDTHTFTVVMTDDSTITNVGTQPNVIATVDGVAVTTGTETAVGNYLVTTANGTLKITPKKVTITAKDASKEYDGTALTQPEFTVSGLAEGDTHTFTVVMTDDSTITNVGTQPNVIATVDGVAVTTGAETAVGNYLVTTANGTLKITPKKVTITAKDASKEYDGTALTQPEFTVSGLAEGDTHTFTVVMTDDSTITNVGTQPNVIATVDGVAVTTGAETAVGNYLVTTANGTLKITPKKVTITAKDASKEYDGTALTQPEFTVSGLAEGDTHTFTVVMTDDSTITNVGTQPNVIATVDGVAVTTGTETAVGNYLVTTANGTLKITPKKVTITAKDASKEYDGTALTQPEFTVSGLAEGDTHTFTVVMTDDSTITDVGTQPNVIATVDGVAVTTGTETAVGNYLVTTANGTLKITPKKVTITAKDASKEYDGTALTQPEFTVSGLAEGDTHTFTVVMTDDSTITDVGTQPNVIATVDGVAVTTGTETAVGNYLVTTANGTLKITPKKVTITAKDASKEYDGTALTQPEFTVSGLAEGDTHTFTVVMTDDSTITDVGTQPNVIATVDGVAVTTGTETAVGNYLVTTANGTLKITPKKVTITAKDASKEYDGTALTQPEFTVSGLAEGDTHTFTVVMTDDSTITDVGTQPNVIATVDGVAVTTGTETAVGNYLVTTANGTLKITPKKVTITAKDASKEYDGTALTQPEFTVSGLAEGDTHTFTVVMTDDSTITDVGTQPNVIATVDGVAVTTGTETAVGNYLVTTANGTLKITPKKVTITAKDASKEYDGTALTQPEFTVSGLAEGDTHTFTVVMTDDSTITDVGTQPNVIATVDGVAVTTGTETAVGNYLVTTANGTLKITPKKVTITAKDASKEYDGTALTQPEFTVSGLAEGDTHTFTVVMTDDSTITNVGTQPNVIATVDGVAVTTGTETAVGNYLVTTANGTLKITPKKVTITAKDASKEYDGTALTQPEFTVSGLAEGDTHTFTVVMTDDSTITNVGTQPNVIATVDGVAVTTGAETAVGNYLVTTANGTLKITPKKVTITAKDASKEYDGTALTQPEFTVSGLAEGDTHTFTVVMTDDSTITDVGTQPNVIATVDGVAVTTGTETAVGNYLVTTANGTLKITPKKVTITAKDASKEYDGTALTQPEFTVSGLAEGDTHTFTVVMTDDSTITDVGTQPNVIATVDGVAVTTGTETAVGNYLVTTANGTLKITPKKVTITAKDASKEYDGTALTQPEFTVSGLAEGDTHTFTVVMTDDSTITNVGTQPNVIATVDGVAVTTGAETAVGNYLVTTANGTLKITPITDKVTVTITENSDEVTYDGQPHTIKGYKSIVADNTLYDVATSVTETETTAWTVTKTDAGTYDMGILAGDFENTNTNFTNVEFKIVDGQLKIKPITDKVTVTITENSDEVTYDGQPHTIKGYKSIVADNTLYDVATSVAETETTAWTVTKTDVGTYDMGILAGDFENTNTNFTNVEFKIVDGQLKINPPDKVTVTITENSDEVTYDGQPHTIKGYKSIVADNTLYDVATSVVETETAAWTVTKTDAGTYDMGIVAGDFENTNTNFPNVEFKIVDGQLKIKPITDKVTVTITENSDEVTYDGQPHTIKGYKSIVADNTLYDVATSVAETETAAWTVTKTDAGTYDMGIVAGDFENTNTNFTNVEFKIVDGQLKIKPITDKVTVTITENSDEVTYDGQPHTIKGYKSIVADNTLYDVATSVAETETAAWTVTKTDAGTYDMGIVAGDFENTNTNFTNVEFKIVDGQLKIKPITDKVTVTITENSDEVTYDGQPHTIKGYKSIVADNTLYDVATSVAETETAAWTVTKTDAGTYDMGIVAGDFENTNTNFTNVEFKIVDGQLKIKPITDKVTVTITENSDEVTYDGQPHTIKGYKSIVADNTLYDVATSVAETETAAWTVTKTDAGTYDMGIVAGDFENTNTNFTNVEFKIVDGQLKIKPITDKVTVTITENSDEVTYDGQPHTIKGYKSIVADNTLYDVATSVAETETTAWTVTKTDAGTYDMGIVAGDFENTNTNFTNVEFKIVDGQLKIKPITDKVTVTITENSDEVTYDGQPHTIKGYKSIVADNTLYDVATSVAETETTAWTITKTDAGTYDMGIVAGDFENTNTNFTNVEFKIVDGQLKIKPITDKVTVTITENSDEVTYDGQPHTIKGYKSIVADNTLYDVATSVAETETTAWTVTKTDAGTYDMGIVAGDFENTNTNFTNVEFKIVDGQLKIAKRAVTLTSGNAKRSYNGEALTNADVEGKNENGLTVETGWVDGEGATYEFTGSQTLVGESPNAFTYTLKDNTKADNYVITKTEGKLIVDDESVPDDLVVKKTADDTVYKLGEEVTFDIWVKNIYDDIVTIKLIEIEGVTLAKDTFEGVEPGAEITTTATYTITEADILAGSFTNTVTARVVEKEWSANASVKVEDPNGHLTVIKETTSETPEGGYKLGETVTYKITVVNDGNLTITDITATDERTGDEWKIDSLAPGESKEYTASTTVTEDDILSGHIINDATAKGKSPDPDEPDVPVDPGHTDDDPEDPNGHLTVIKETTSETPEGGYKLGETVSYKITVVNDGNLTITDIKVLDERTGDEWPVASLAPGESKEFTASTSVTEDDILSGHIINEATATGKSPDPDKPDVPVTPDETDDDPEDPNGHLTVIKETTSETPEGGYKLGETVSYKITVVNDGNLTITEIKVLDERTGDEWAVDSLAPGESRTFEASTTVTEEDILSKHIINEATAKGKSPDPDKPDVPVTPDETDDDPEDPNGHLTVIKETTSETPEGGYKLGETLNYKITVVNDGNLTITEITVTDDRTGDAWKIDSLKPGDSKEFEASTTVTEEDILSEHIINEATAKGKSPDPDKPDVPVTPDETDDDPEDPNGHLTVNKETTSTPKDENGYAEGEVISYKITVVNDGNLTITNINVIDDLTGDKWPVESLAPGATKEFETKYTVTAADAAAGEVLNVATAEGKSPDPKKPDVPVTPGEDPEPTIETKVTLIIRYWIGSKDGELINTINRVEKVGTAYDVATPPIEGYTADTERVKGVLDKDMEYDVVYTANDYTLTILYKYMDGTEAAATYTEVLHAGDEYSVESPVVRGYYTNKKKVEGTMPARDVTVTVIYVKNPVIITIDDFETPLGIGLGSINVGETIE
ncbi:DUF7507 domain-containing protein [Aristaeella hokkaidonensis]|uniref:DUF7507 domain-containing protein n=2 Tax=Aristaeella hokkaidonensis TaxID=3046382 RepID=UPI00272D0DA2|nr:hypothetical protein [Aristaeella hokkaidonensis]